jgi:hypothetical protein
MDHQEIHPGLWQGRWPPPGAWLARKGFTTLVLCAEEYQPPHSVHSHFGAVPGVRSSNPWPGVEVLYAPNDDNFEVPPSRERLRLALKAARVVAKRLSQQRKVLVTCNQGRNRSGLVSAMALHFHLGISGRTAAKIVQAKRINGLRNPIFCELLSNLRHESEAVAAPPLPADADLQRIAAVGAPQLVFTFPSGRL